MRDMDKKLLNDYQRDFPLTPRPFATIAEEIGSDEASVLAAFRRHKLEGKVSRIGAIVRNGAIGASTLAAMQVPTERLAEVAARVSARPEVNHNYEREHRFNLWFVVTAADRAGVEAALEQLEAETGLAVLELPMVEAYYLDLGFDLKWS
jgi:DNA-binding Lrp family transcriptional regulator